MKSLDGFSWGLHKTPTEHACEWPNCQNGETVYGSKRVGNRRSEHWWFCDEHYRDATGYHNLALHLEQLAPPARRKYDKTKAALDAMGIDSGRPDTIGDWLDGLLGPLAR